MSPSSATPEQPTNTRTPLWRVALDTGGTFTDVVGIDPHGARHRVKVPSDGSLSATLESCAMTKDGVIATVTPAARLRLPNGFLDGWSLEGLSSNGALLRMLIRTQRCTTLVLEALDGSSIEARELFAASSAVRCIQTKQTGAIDAPRIGLHLITGTPLSRELPPIEIRLSTTRGTNALLESHGARVGVLVSAGLTGVVTIADQTRNDLFARIPKERRILAHAVRALPERSSANGAREFAASNEEIRAACEQLRRDGCDIIVVSLAHALADVGRELEVAHVARSLGFQAIAASVVAPHPRLQTRTETAIVAARIAPTLHAFVDDALQTAPRDVRAFVFTSAGVLQSAHAFEPRDTLFSGPAGGAVAMQILARRHGARRALGFDMGGTSSDVSRIADGTIAMRRESSIASATVAAPALAIDSIAAGGGSICRVRDGICEVGPDSAGSNPGPACYGRGGPLTISDINLLAGRLVSEVGIGNASMVLDPGAAARALDAVAKESGIAGETLIESFLAIANARMALAMENLCVRDGIDPRGEGALSCDTAPAVREPSEAHTLFAFGGAGGQHACAIASRLGLPRIVFPHSAGFLCASGVLAAQPARISSEPVLAILDAADDTLREAYERALRDATHALARDGFDLANPPKILAHAALRLLGQEATIEVAWAESASMRRAFHARFEELFGYPPPDRAIEVESVRVEARVDLAKETPARIDAHQHSQSESLMASDAPPRPATSVRMLANGRWQVAQVFERSTLAIGARIDGPAIIIDAGESVVLDVGWTARVTASLDLVADATTAQPARSSGAALELFAARLEAIALGMGHLLERTALSPNIRDRLDFSCAILDATGTLIQNAPHLPVHLGALGLCTRLVAEALDLADGDIAVTNHPAFGGSHLPDVTTVAPVFVDGRRVAFVAVRAHHAEIGGTRPGSFPPDATCLAEEGVVLPPFLAVQRGTFDRAACRARFAEGPYPSRNPSENLADLEAQIAATRHGVRQVAAFALECGSAFDVLCEGELARADRAMQRAITRLLRATSDRSAIAPTLHGEAQLDDGSIIRVTVRVKTAPHEQHIEPRVEECTEQKRQQEAEKSARLQISFAGSAAQHARNFNAPLAITRAATLYVLRLLIDEPIPMNEGLLRSVDLDVPEGILRPRCVADPQACPPVVAGNVETSQSVVAALIEAFGLAAESQSTMNNTLFGNARSTIYETLGGGAGAGPTHAGASGVHVHMSNTRLTDVDVLERRAPVIIRRFELREHSGGRGMYRGGDGLIRSYEFREPVSLSFFGSRRRVAPRGSAGGCDGVAGLQHITIRGVETPITASVMSVELGAGDRFTVETPGGGGWGNAG